MNSKNSKATIVSCNSPSWLSKDVSKTNYSTTKPPVNSLANTIAPDGDGDARMKAMIIFMRRGCSGFQSPDWLMYNPEGQIEAIEVKYKDLYEPPPFRGAGLDVKQAERRMRLLSDKNIRTWLIVFGKGVSEGETYLAYIDELERKGGYFDTSGIRIYPLSSFKCIAGKGAYRNDN